MYTCANASRRWVAIVAMTLFVFQALIASSAVATAGLASGKGAMTTIICTASGPRVVTVDGAAQAQGSPQHSGALPHCCTAGCAMVSGMPLTQLFVLAWFVPPAAYAVPTPPEETPFSSALARLQQRSRAPPLSA